MGEGIYIQYPNNSCLLMNPRYGSVRAVKDDQRVILLAPVKDMEVRKVKDASEAHKYLKR